MSIKSAFLHGVVHTSARHDVRPNSNANRCRVLTAGCEHRHTLVAMIVHMCAAAILGMQRRDSCMSREPLEQRRTGQSQDPALYVGIFRGTRIKSASCSYLESPSIYSGGAFKQPSAIAPSQFTATPTSHYEIHHCHQLNQSSPQQHCRPQILSAHCTHLH